MRGDGLPASRFFSQTVRRDKDVITIHPEPVIQRDTDADRSSAPVFRYAVAVTPHLDIAIPGHLPDIVITGIEVSGGQGLQVGLLQDKARCRCLIELAKWTVVSFRLYPLHQQLIDMCQAVELPVTNEEVLLEVFHHALHLAFGLCPAWAAGAWREAIVFCQLEEAVVEDNLATVVMFENGRFLVINQHGFDATAKAGEGFDQRLIGMLGILTIRRPGMEVPGVTQGIHGDVHLAALAVDNRLDFTPVVLELLTGLCFEAYGLSGRPQSPFGMHILTQSGATSAVSVKVVGTPAVLSPEK